MKPAVCKPGEVVEYQFDPEHFEVTEEMIEAFRWDGVVIVRSVLDSVELAKIESSFYGENTILDRGWQMDDGQGMRAKQVLWNHPGEDITGMVARSEKVATTSEKLLGGEVYHYHTKLIQKEPRTGGSFRWHQDYGYWYSNGCLKPDMMTVFIAMDRCVQENGCLQVLLGSHRCGRIDHLMEGGQTVADPARVEDIKKHFDLVFLQLEPGDAAFFHCNLLHTSAQNKSDMRRYAFLCAYNRADNDPVIEHHHPRYTPLIKVPDRAIRECTNVDLSGKDVMDPLTVHNVRVYQEETGVPSGLHM